MSGLTSEPFTLNAGADTAWKGATVYGIHGRDTFTTWEIANNLLSSGTIDIEPLVTHRFSFPNFEEAFRLRKAQQTGKVILNPE